MEEPSSHGGISRGNFVDHSGVKPAEGESGNVDDPPPIPSASPSKQLTEKSAGGSRLETTTIQSTHEHVDISISAHALACGEVATRLSTSLQYVQQNSYTIIRAQLISAGLA
jgi:hypothetical protein